jgi:hypothetical protein
MAKRKCCLSRTAASLRTLAVIVKRQTDYQNIDKKMKDSRPFAELKEVLCQHTSRHKSTTFNFARPHDNKN